MPRPELIQAAIGIEGIIWLIVIVIWILGQVLSKGKRPARRTPGPPTLPGEPHPMEEELRGLFETITGQHAEPRPTTPPLPPRRPEPRARAKAATAAIEHTPRAAAVEHITAPMPNIEAGHVTPASLSSGHTGMNLRSMTLPAHLLNIPAMQFGLSSSVSRTAEPLIAPADLREPQAARQLILGRIIFGPPRALDPFPLEGPARN